ncbi:hypothetical protein [Alkalimarinus alittae]|uniref:Uncharacterized protein n=1 Tax=Alkalimarinus alittae TaxID=2961619 RepID=A0ABY6N319_9ALTE|nr:hypothetical protein [Alkalimarinus alittae]UZE96420.1 hypothetical protein NKI27_01355 [Alkalimarinus alittae]
MQYQQNDYFERLTRLHSLKLQQADRAKISPNSLMYMVLKAEADAISQELKSLQN